MNKNVKIAFLILAALLLSSCTRLLLNTLIIGRGGAEKADYLENTQTGKSVVLVGMVHLGTPEYYEAARVLLDSLKRADYVVFFEGVRQDSPRVDSILLAHRPLDARAVDSLRALYPPTAADSLALDTLQRKMRRVIGHHLAGGYKNADNRSLPKAITRSDYVMQSNEALGLLEGRNELVDLSLVQLLEAYEAARQPIVLTDYDFQTGLFEPYARRKSKDGTRHSTYTMLYTLRNDHVIRAVEESSHERIVILYGDGHRDMLRETLLQNGYVKR